MGALSELLQLRWVPCIYFRNCIWCSVGASTIAVGALSVFSLLQWVPCWYLQNCRSSLTIYSQLSGLLCLCFYSCGWCSVFTSTIMVVALSILQQLWLVLSQCIHNCVSALSVLQQFPRPLCLYFHNCSGCSVCAFTIVLSALSMILQLRFMLCL